MQIGKLLRTIIVEPLESPVPATTPDPKPDNPEPVVPTHKPETEPEPERVTR
jgi:hypothetical protein